MAQGEGYITVVLKDRALTTGNAPPSSPTLGDSWYDTNSKSRELKHWNGSDWVVDKYKQFGNIQETLRTQNTMIQTNAKGISQLISDITMEIVDGKPVYVKQAYNSLKETAELFERELYYDNGDGTRVSRITQAADKIALMVKGGIGSSGLTLTQDMLDVVAKNINLRGNTTFSTLYDLTATENNKTVIDGAKIKTGSISANQIKTGSITAKQIDVTDLFSQNITATGTINGAKIAGGSINGSNIVSDFVYDDKIVNRITISEGVINIEDHYTSALEDALGFVGIKLFGRYNKTRTDISADELHIYRSNNHGNSIKYNKIIISTSSTDSCTMTSSGIHIKSSSNPNIDINSGHIKIGNEMCIYEDSIVAPSDDSYLKINSIECKDLSAPSKHFKITAASGFQIDANCLCTCTKILDVVLLSFRINGTIPAGTAFTHVATVPSSYRPALQTPFVTSVSSNVNSGSNCSVYVDTNGRIMICQHGSTNASTAMVNISYKI